MFEVSRRKLVLGAAGAAAMFGISRPMEFIGSANAQRGSSSDELKGFQRTKVGDIEVNAVFDGWWEKAHDAGFIKNASVDNTKAALAAAGLPTDYVLIPFTPNVVKTGGKVVMIDVGTGGQLSPKAGHLIKAMSMAGYKPEQVDTIIISHLHMDHFAGLASKAPENKLTYPKAELLISAPEYKFWIETPIDSLPKGAQGGAARAREIFALMKDRVKQFEWGKEVAPGITSIATPGHTPGHTSFRIASGKDQLIIGSDITNIPALFAKNPGWHAAFDADPVLAEKSRRELFERVVAEKAMVTGYHFPFPAHGRIAKDGNGYVFTTSG